jgi:ABC-type transport system involved in cytochrome c biogenesis permease subunit
MKNLACFLLLFFICVSSARAQPQHDFDFGDWGSLPVLHDGRVKPLDSFARATLKGFSGRDHAGSLSASEWLGYSVFDPSSVMDIPLFRFRQENNPDKSLYSYQEAAAFLKDREEAIGQLLETPEKDWSVQQKNLMTLHQNFIVYTQILRSLTLLLPLNGEEKNNSYLDYKKKRDDINRKIKNIVRQKGSDFENYTDDEKEIAALSFQLKLIQEGGNNNILFRIIPAEGEWESPWNIIKSQNIPAETLEYMRVWEDMAHTYRAGEIEHFQSHVKEAQTLLPDNVNYLKIKAEKIYDALSLIDWTLFLYGISFLSSILFFRLGKNVFYQVAMGTIGIGILLHTAHIAFRIFILSRPPVGTLYESILFVSLISVAGLIFLSLKQKNKTALLMGGILGTLLLATATAFAADDTLGPLVAVLNTNFWLTVHVLCITAGYGLCLITSLMGHYMLLQRAQHKPFETIHDTMKTMAIFSLLFVTVGTILGGLWADQSWGRFWGWDPKENGALLIILWLVWLLHGRVSKHLDRLAYAAGMAALSIIVVLAWFGVNLLNVGLHSYGFISGVAWGIGLFCAFEILTIGGLWHYARLARSNAAGDAHG